jgi:glucose/arabinose dehydrogenase
MTISGLNKAFGPRVISHLAVRVACRALAALALASCSPLALAQGPNQTVSTSAGPAIVEKLAGGLVHPWGIARLPDGRLLVTERAGRLRILNTDGTLSPPLAGTPAVVAVGQGGLLDVALDPDFADNRLVYLSFAEQGSGGGVSTAVGRGRLEGDRIADFQVVFSQKPKVSGPNHFGGRIVFAPDGRLILTLGERFKSDPAQDLKSHLGKVIRVERDGRVPPDNPFVGRADALPEIWSYGHRNVQSAAFHPQTGELWIGEMGPRGGDELNRVEAGRNYGWPEVSWGRQYSGIDIADPPTRPEFADSVLSWTPVISPAGMEFYQADAFNGWRGSMLVGGLTTREIVRVVIDGQSAREVERIPMGGRVRDLLVAPDGTVLALTDAADGSVLRLRPVN